MQKDINNLPEATDALRQHRSSESPISASRAALSHSRHSNKREGHQALMSWNDTATLYSNTLCIHELFEAQVTKCPSAVAVVCGDQQLSYQELNQRANQLACHLIDEGVEPDSLVGICLERSFDMVIAILAVLKAGGAYVPLDPDYPRPRLEYMAKDAALGIVLTHKRHQGKLSGSESRSICLGDASTSLGLSRLGWGNIDADALGLKPSSLAYVIYTSGSTGNPKGVMIEHGALVNRIEWMANQYGCDASDVVLQKTPFSFDVSVWEFFLPLTAGASMVLAKPGGHKDPVYLRNIIHDRAVTKLHFVPSMFNAVLYSVKLAECKSLRQVFCSGEALQPSHVGEFFRQGIAAELHNLYGPTEASIDVSYWPCIKEDAGRSSVPIGRPIANIQLYVIDERREIAAPGVAGELHIGGAGLARGYLNRPELTAEKFISDHFSDDPKARLYRTGDLCRYLPDGNIEFIGRLDHQVKIRGFRIELGEIENTLLQQDVIRNAVVLSKDLPEGGKCLVAYLVCDTEPVVSELREHLEKNLPDYMVPSAFLVIPELPLTPSGKIDRNELLSRPLHNAGEDRAEDLTFLQDEVYKIWQRVLGYNDFDLDDDLFRIGGDSLAAVQIFTAINNEFGINIYMDELFSSENFSIRWLADLVERYQIGSIGEAEYHRLLSQIEEMSEEEVAKLLLD